MVGVVLAALAAAVLVGSPPSLERLGSAPRRWHGRRGLSFHGSGRMPGSLGKGTDEERKGLGARVAGLTGEETREQTTAQGGGRRRSQRLSALSLGAVALACTCLSLGPIAAGWALVAGIVAWTAAWVISRVAAERARRDRADEAARAAVGLALLLRAGQIPSAALTEMAGDCPMLAPVAAAASLGADVPQAFHEVAALPGREGLRRVAGAWRVAERTGAPVASVLQQVAEGLRDERELVGLVEAELAMARGSSRVMAALPLGALLLGTLVGADPLGFLIRSPFGVVLALVGVSLAALGVVWTERLAARA